MEQGFALRRATGRSETNRLVLKADSGGTPYSVTELTLGHRRSSRPGNSSVHETLRLANKPEREEAWGSPLYLYKLSIRYHAFPGSVAQERSGSARRQLHAAQQPLV